MSQVPDAHASQQHSAQPAAKVEAKVEVKDEKLPRYGHCSKIGVRPTMEDEVVFEPEFTIGNNKYAFYAVFDGHGGPSAAAYAKKHVFDTLVENLKAGKSVKESFTIAYTKTDEDFIKTGVDTSGTTAISVLVDFTGKTIIAANAGDSRAVLAREDKAIALSKDHKATRPDEMERVKKAGGFIINNRVMGDLAISRSIGDPELKTAEYRLIIAEPEFMEEQLTDKDEFLLLACDGLFDVFSNNDAVAFLKKKLEESTNLDSICEQIVDTAINVKKTRDNVSVILVNLKRYLS